VSVCEANALHHMRCRGERSRSVVACAHAT
jgi:hypothetical protein